MIEIITYPDTFLRQTATPVKDIDESIQEMIDKMAVIMYETKGVGLAATQIRCDKSFFIYDVAQKENKRHLQTIINPKIIVSEKTMVSKNEGCLSVPDFRSNVRRAVSVIVEGFNKKGKPIKIEAEGLEAVVLQHEIDHLNGKLFIDRISSLKRQLYKRRIKKKLRQKK